VGGKPLRGDERRSHAPTERPASLKKPSVADVRKEREGFFKGCENQHTKENKKEAHNRHPKEKKHKKPKSKQGGERRSKLTRKKSTVDSPTLKKEEKGNVRKEENSP